MTEKDAASGYGTLTAPQRWWGVFDSVKNALRVPVLSLRSARYRQCATAVLCERYYHNIFT